MTALHAIKGSVYIQVGLWSEASLGKWYPHTYVSDSNLLIQQEAGVFFPFC